MGRRSEAHSGDAIPKGKESSRRHPLRSTRRAQPDSVVLYVIGSRYSYGMQSRREGRTCDRIGSKTAWPVRTARADHPLQQLSRLFERHSLIFYDAGGAGGGICAKAFDHSEPSLSCASVRRTHTTDFPVTSLLEQALSTIESCDCDDDEGCASCA